MAMGPAPSRRSRRGRAPMAEINVTPLVDVMLVLLIIFMVTAPLLSAGVPVNLPDANAKPLNQNPEEISLTIAADGVIYLGDAALEPGALAQKLAEVPPAPDGKPPQVTLRADRNLGYGRVMAVMGELNRAGFTAIALVTTGSVPSP
ncbi:MULTISPECIES: biopolymer transporter ExbD [unclassified Novosphingobium]|uniref:ExbD/TolR family protein n=1 Tax=unclassified Novosphingobium TaxID=2644732 RepID=UPI000ECBE327|nr:MULTISPECIES: biopolymer transporter ExbD [unclassified Novosphingobium]HCF24865.1 protein TolR [Novosphingobium sp.]HQV04372.1 biopolymer transporter ExbD [Novosphingobium sp.]